MCNVALFYTATMLITISAKLATVKSSFLLDMVLSSRLLRRRANSQNVSYTPYPTAEKHTISTFVDQTYIQRTRPRRKTVFSKLAFQSFLLAFISLFNFAGAKHIVQGRFGLVERFLNFPMLQYADLIRPGLYVFGGVAFCPPSQ